MEPSMAEEVFEVKTPEEIKYALHWCRNNDTNNQCLGCPYKKIEDCEYALDTDALAYIQRLEKSCEENCTNCAFARDAAWQCQACRWCNDKAMKIMWMQGPRKDGRME